LIFSLKVFDWLEGVPPVGVKSEVTGTFSFFFCFSFVLAAPAERRGSMISFRHSDEVLCAQA
jgi:hypothetical protein